MDEKALGRYAPRRVNMSGDARGSRQNVWKLWHPRGEKPTFTPSNLNSKAFRTVRSRPGTFLQVQIVILHTELRQIR
ncbi:hypothetical protein E3N88_04947 [Mikania micrantha]|nr:hypothetical protein E3N88_12606 [Mikania micrantha]KAD7117679.1 hypothetical protein E3N88_04947 [Mikania micrantha]